MKIEYKLQVIEKNEKDFVFISFIQKIINILRFIYLIKKILKI